MQSIFGITIPSSVSVPLPWTAPISVNLPSFPAPALPSAASIAEVFEGSAFRDVFKLSGLGSFPQAVEVNGINDLGTLALHLAGSLGKPDSTGEVQTGGSAIPREEVAVAATLAAAPRIVHTLGPDAETVDVRGQSFSVAEIYDDPVSGFLAVRLTPLQGGMEVFAIDGLQVGSRADEVAAATLGRLQAQSTAFTEMVADAAASASTPGHEVLLTGPSLGGALAQVAAYEVAETLQKSGVAHPTGTVQLVTVDALGGRDAAEAVNGGTLDPTALAMIEALNIRTDGDIISRIGSHIGATLTLPALDAAGNPVTLSPSDAHVDVVSLLQNLSSDARFAAGVMGPPAEISAFAAASNAASDQVIRAYLASGAQDKDVPVPLQIPGTAQFDASGTLWSLDADDNGTVDIAVHLSKPVDPGTASLVL